MVTTRRAGAATTANSTEDRFVFADFKLIGALALLREVRPDASGGIAAVTAVSVFGVGVLAVAERASG